MRAWYRGLHNTAISSVRRFLLADIFDNNRYGFAVLQEYIASLHRVNRMLDFQSSFANDYFRELWLKRTKHNYRTALKFYLVTSTVILLDSYLMCPLERVESGVYWSFASQLLLLFYLLTFRRWSHEFYCHMSITVALIHIGIQLPVRCGVYSLNPPLWSSVFVTVISMFVLLPVRIELGICIIVIYIVLLETLDACYNSATYPRDLKTSSNDVTSTVWFQFDLTRVMESVTRMPERTFKVVITRTLLWLLVFLGAIYLGLWSRLRRKFAFFKLGYSVQSRVQSQRAHEVSSHWIATIMPAQVSAEYQRLRQVNEHSDVTDWLYMKTLENVSILFADIVGFTKLSSKLTALQLVILLGDMMTQFDDVCQATHCEKLGTLGDCYYCMSGGQDYEVPHGVCCVEMGLSMVQVLKRFNAERQTSVNIRVGIHTGIAHAAILGFDRFRYDVYSHDVRIANELESTGRPGFIHISQPTYELVKDVYPTTQGPDLVVDKKDKSFLASQTAAKVSIPTYFIEPTVKVTMTRSVYDRYAHPRRRSTKPSPMNHSEPSGLDWSSSEGTDSTDSITVDSGSTQDVSSSSSSGEWFEFELSPEALADIKLSHQTNAMQLQQDMQLIRDLRTDPAKQHGLFQTPPVEPILLQFRDPEVEWHYQCHLRDNTGPTFVDSEKLARVFDATLIFVLIILLTAVGSYSSMGMRQILLYSLIFGIALISFVTQCFIGTTYPDRIPNKWIRVYYEVASYPLMCELNLAISTCIPTLLSLCYRQTMLNNETASAQMYLVSVLNYLSILTHCLPSSSAFWARCGSLLVTLFLLTFPIEDSVHLLRGDKCCLTNRTLFNGIVLDQWIIVHWYHLIICAVLVVVVTRETEWTCKLCFFVHREAQIEGEFAEKSSSEAMELLYNIVPAYVFDEIKESGNGDLTNLRGSLHYAVAHQMVGVAFVSVSNYFTMLYREDSGGAERSLRLLHNILCTFDKLLKHVECKDVEKIKSMNENYMVAAGLNRREVAKNADKQAHLCALMRYCFLLRKALYEIRVYEGAEKGLLMAKIGYNAGPVTAGIIGTTKLHYDIWGDAVNVASRMCYTGVPGPVQVTEETQNLLKGRFEFTYRGIFFVKGKGMMRTYTCQPLKALKSRRIRRQMKEP